MQSGSKRAIILVQGADICLAASVIWVFHSLLFTGCLEQKTQLNSFF